MHQEKGTRRKPLCLRDYRPQFSFVDELPLEAPPEVLQQLADLLPDDGSPVLVREEHSVGACPHVRSLVISIIGDALAKGYCIDRSNGDGPLSEWNGWLVIYGEKARTFIQTNWKNGT